MEHLPSSVVDDVATRDDIATDDNACDWPCCLTLACWHDASLPALSQYRAG
ncbi:hypothetical protein [Paraburkholderia diazotrophica]|uniref:Uncharacterized protein n=1 Tax=Paraburkholderia diazotrophica TaxID=667676 RepID=A0A1H7EG26_9BURK|nr:hypothetical protein [Paraburkholderia diazotrophica]SEK12584.1 hypothetical protein SAMN05192539_105911 [Paraburkholderia diazotrophica]